ALRFDDWPADDLSPGLLLPSGIKSTPAIPSCNDSPVASLLLPTSLSNRCRTFSSTRSDPDENSPAPDGNSPANAADSLLAPFGRRPSPAPEPKVQPQGKFGSHFFRQFRRSIRPAHQSRLSSIRTNSTTLSATSDSRTR